MDSFKKIKVVVVEDEELLLQVITRKLSTLGFDVVSCKAAKQALDYMGSMEAEELPDVVWLDYYLGEDSMTGLQFMQTMKGNSKLADIPVVVVSNSASEEKRDAMLALGAKKYILKAEHRLDEIIESINDILKKH